MAVPKRKTSRSNTRSRRANWKTTPVALTSCPSCGAAKRPHMACGNAGCGQYNGRRVLDV